MTLKEFLDKEGIKADNKIRGNVGRLVSKDYTERIATKPPRVSEISEKEWIYKACDYPETYLQKFGSEIILKFLLTQ